MIDPGLELARKIATGEALHLPRPLPGGPHRRSPLPRVERHARPVSPDRSGEFLDGLTLALWALAVGLAFPALLAWATLKGVGK